MQNPPATLLIVDDEPSIRHSLSQSLAEMGYSARSAADGFSALREIHCELPELLLSDLEMPGMSGFELLAVVRRRFPAIRTIAMSGSFSGDEVPFGVAADAYYQKGSSILALMRIMENLPRMERYAYQSSGREEPISIHRKNHDLEPNEQVIITCPACLRTFSQMPGTGYSQRKTVCIHCHSTIPYAIVPHTGQISLQAIRREAKSARNYQLTASNPSY